MKSADYWKKRSEQIAARQFKTTDGFDLEQRKEYAQAAAAIKRDIEAFYARFAKNNEIDMAEARKLLTAGELKEFKMTLKEFTVKAKNNADGQWTKELNNVYYRTRVSRLEALLVQVNQQVEMLAGKRQAGTGDLLGGVYKDTYYRTIYELQKGTGIGVSFARIDDEGLKTILGAKLDGRNWSQRIWDDRTKLRQELQTKLSQSFIRGDSIDRTVKDVVERLNVSRSNAERLVQTESAFFVGQATMSGYKASGVVDRYEVLATLDGRTTPICREMDGKVFLLSEMQVGVNYPPFHVLCRTTTVPYFDDEINPGKRIARDADGQSYMVPGDITYEDWKKQYVDSSNGGIMETGAYSGAIKDPVRQQKHADTYYEFIRKRKDDVAKIAKHTGWKERAIQDIKNHVFIKEHMLQGKMQRFYPDYDQAQVWQRLIEGKNIKPSDLVFLKHEFVELTQMRIYGYVYEQAHEIANKYHNWYKLILDEEE